VTCLIAFSIGAYARTAAAAGLTVILPCGCTMIDTVGAHLLSEPGWDGMSTRGPSQAEASVRDLGPTLIGSIVRITSRFVPLRALSESPAGRHGGLRLRADKTVRCHGDLQETTRRCVGRVQGRSAVRRIQNTSMGSS
jgi:hypothetical protein